MSSSQVLFARFTARAGQELRVRELLAWLAGQVREEPGNILFEASSLQGAPQEFFVYEVYSDAEAFSQHIASDHSTRFNEELRHLIEEPSSELTWLRPC